MNAIHNSVTYFKLNWILIYIFDSRLPNINTIIDNALFSLNWSWICIAYIFSLHILRIFSPQKNNRRTQQFLVKYKQKVNRKNHAYTAPIFATFFNWIIDLNVRICLICLNSIQCLLHLFDIQCSQLRLTQGYILSTFLVQS